MTSKDRHCMPEIQAGHTCFSGEQSHEPLYLRHTALETLSHSQAGKRHWVGQRRGRCETTYPQGHVTNIFWQQQHVFA